MYDENIYGTGSRNTNNGAEQSYTAPTDGTYHTSSENGGWQQDQNLNQSQNMNQNLNQSQNMNQNLNQNQNQNMQGSGWQPQNMQQIPDRKDNRKKKSSGGAGRFFKKLGVIVASALLFGGIAGGTMIGINRLAGKNEPAAVAASSGTGTSAAADAGKNDNAGQAGKDGTSGKTDTKSGENDIKKNSSSTGTNSGSTSSGNLDVSAIVEKAMPSVVAINGTAEVQQSNLWGQTQSYEAKAAGSGIIIGENDDELLVVTNNHVVEGIDKGMQVTFIDNTSVDAVVKGTDENSDIAIVAVKKSDISSDTMGKISIASMGDSDSLKVGQGVIAIGNAMGYGQSVTVGYVSALNRTIEATDSSTGATVKTENLLQTDAAINPGNSGGALLDMNGNVIGINESKAVSTSVEGMGYAIPISKVQTVISTLSSQKTRTVVSDDKQGSIGIQGQNIDDEMSGTYDMPKGIYVYKILENGAAAKSDLQEKDIITKIDGQSISTLAELKKKLTYYAEGESVTLTVERLNGSQYEEKEVQVTLGSMSALQSEANGNSGNNGNSQNGNNQNGNGQSSNGQNGNGQNGNSQNDNGQNDNGQNSSGDDQGWNFRLP